MCYIRKDSTLLCTDVRKLNFLVLVIKLFRKLGVLFAVGSTPEISGSTIRRSPIA